MYNNIPSSNVLYKDLIRYTDTHTYLCIVYMYIVSLSGGTTFHEVAASLTRKENVALQRLYTPPTFLISLTLPRTLIPSFSLYLSQLSCYHYLSKREKFVATLSHQIKLNLIIFHFTNIIRCLYI